MRVALVSATFPPYFGGTGNVVAGNARALAARGHDVVVVTARRRGPPPRDPGGFVVRRHRPLLRVGNAPCLPQLAGLRGFDVVHLHYPFVFGAEYVLVAEALRRFPLVVTCHQDLNFGGALRLAQKGYEALVKRRVLARARRILTPSLDHARHASLAPLLAAAPDRIVEVPNGVDADRFFPGPPSAALAERYGLRDAPVVLFVGGLDPPHRFKGVDVLLRAFATLDPRTRLLLVGDGSLRPGFERLARDLGVAPRVVFAGRVEEHALADHYRLASVVVLPSTTPEEIFGLALAEGMATGKPVVGTALPGVRSVVDDGRNGLLAAPGDVGSLADALARILALSPAARAEMGRAGREKALVRYGWEGVGKLLEGVYEEAAA